MGQTGVAGEDLTSSIAAAAGRFVSTHTRRVVVIAFALAIVASACGDDGSPTFGDGIRAEDCPAAERLDDGSCRTAPRPPDEVVVVDEIQHDLGIVTEGAVPLVTARCGPVVFDSLEPDFGAFEPFDQSIRAIMPEDALAEYDLSFQWFDSLDWRTVAGDEASLMLLGIGTDENGPVYGYVTVDVSGDAMRVGGWGGCTMSTVAEGFRVASFDLDPSNPPDPEAFELHVLATERNCAGGQVPSGRQVIPVVVEAPDAVEISILVEPVRGVATCQGNPSFPLTVSLSAPLADRAILDAALLPPTQKPWPIPIREGRLEVAAAGDTPRPGTANVVAWDGLYGGALMFGDYDWWRLADGFQRFSGAVTISGFVTSCGPDGCIEECENEGNPLRDQEVYGDDDNEELPLCSDLPRLGDECSYTYTPTIGEDAFLTVHFSGTMCTIKMSTTPIAIPESVRALPCPAPSEDSLCIYPEE